MGTIRRQTIGDIGTRLSWLVRFAHHLPPYLRVTDPDIDPSILLHDNITSPFPSLKIAQRRLITRHRDTTKPVSSPVLQTFALSSLPFVLPTSLLASPVYL
jgi:hypothetical protein